MECNKVARTQADMTGAEDMDGAICGLDEVVSALCELRADIGNSPGTEASDVKEAKAVARLSSVLEFGPDRLRRKRDECLSLIRDIRDDLRLN